MVRVCICDIFSLSIMKEQVGKKVDLELEEVKEGDMKPKVFTAFSLKNFIELSFKER